MDQDIITSRQLEALYHICALRHLRMSVTIRKLGQLLGGISPNAVAGLLKSLESRGLISRERKRAASISPACRMIFFPESGLYKKIKGNAAGAAPTAAPGKEV
jgi:SOS-response transcriptional repressor LexA